MPKYSHQLVPLSSLLSITDQSEIKAIGSVQVPMTDGRIMLVTVMGTNAPAAIACTIPDVEFDETYGPKWTTDEHAAMGSATDDMLTVLRLTCDAALDYLRMPNGNIMLMFRGNEDPELTFDLQLSWGNFHVLPEWSDIESTFSTLTSKGLTHMAKLMADGAASRLPSEYRFLSYYKAAELEHEGKTAAFFESIDPQSSDIADPLRPPLRTLLPGLRAKAAHGKAKGARSPGLTAEDVAAVNNLLPLMREGLFKVLSSKYSIKLLPVEGGQQSNIHPPDSERPTQPPNET